MSTTSHDRTAAVQRRVNSAIWAAWADALGFISELTDPAGLRRRLGDCDLDEPVAWSRRVGGKFGATTTLPAGTYSDDTQLRLAVGRAIRPAGFDPEAFAKVELPVWTSYALGGGRASKAAASNISSPTVPWFGNFFKGWTAAGGNGAAMRIQPHVWAAHSPAEHGPHLMDVLADSIITHGHPRALVGSLFHAISLGFTLDRGFLPTPTDWATIIESMHRYPSLLRENAELSMWCSSWERETGRPIDAAWKATLIEVSEMLPAAEEFSLKASSAAAQGDLREISDLYEQLVTRLALRSPESRGSGTSSAVAALAVSLAGSEYPREILRLIVGALGTDTDTIATMAAALVGAVTAETPPGPIMDRDYIAAEAARLAGIALGEQTESGFSYPDLLRWDPPRTQADALGVIGQTPALAGLGLCEKLETAASTSAFTWSWATLDLGQTVLVKHRVPLKELLESQRPAPRAASSTATQMGQPQDPDPGIVQLDDVENPQRPNLSEEHQKSPTSQDVNVDAMLTWLRRQGYTDSAIGYAVRRISEVGTREQMIAFTATLQAEIKNREAP